MITLPILTLWLTTAHLPPPPVRLERRVAAMGTYLTVTVEAVDRARALAASEAVVRAVEATERRLSTWRDDSELAALNRAPVGVPFVLSRESWEEMVRARECWRDTGGAFDPTLGRLVEAWGLRRGGRRPSTVELAAARAAAGAEGLDLPRRGVAVRRSELEVEEGGFGKGAALDRASEALASSPGVVRASLDFGGQVTFHGSAGKGGWVAVADPYDRDRAVAFLSVDGGSVATSGNGERGIEVEGERRSHLLDPRRGEPAPEAGTVTVWADTGLRADCLATGLYVLGPEAAVAWAAEHPGVEALSSRRTEGGRLVALASPGLRGRLEWTEEVELEIWTEGEARPEVDGESKTRTTGRAVDVRRERPAAP